jgi:hypothetical protein
MSPQNFALPPFFPHRRNRDGSFDSICLNCFVTVASRGVESELSELEEKHFCKHASMVRDCLPGYRVVA